MIRFEDEVGIELTCAGRDGFRHPAESMTLRGNMALRGVSGRTTQLAYECRKCFRRALVVDDWDHPNAAVIDAIDLTP